MAKSSLPEVTVSEGQLTDLAREAVAVRAQIAELQAREALLKSQLAATAETKRKAELETDNFIGLIRVSGKDNEGNALPPIRVEFRMKQTAINPGEESRLQNLFGGALPSLFGREKAVTGITDKDQLINDLRQTGKDPWDFLELSVKETTATTVVDNSTAVEYVDAYLPKKGMLSAINQQKHVLSQEAKDYLKSYVNDALSPTPVIGSKGKS